MIDWTLNFSQLLKQLDEGDQGLDFLAVNQPESLSY